MEDERDARWDDFFSDANSERSAGEGEDFEMDAMGKANFQGTRQEFRALLAKQQAEINAADLFMAKVNSNRSIGEPSLNGVNMDDIFGDDNIPF